MIVATIAEANQIISSCCPCTLPDCDEPQKECQSIRLYSCGWTLAELVYPEILTGLPDDVIHHKYRTRSDTLTEYNSGIWTIDTVTGEYTERIDDNNYETIKSLTPITYQAYLPFGPYCAESFTTSDSTYENLKDYDSSNTLLQENTSSNFSTSSDTTACSGTTTYSSTDYTVSPPVTTGGSFSNPSCSYLTLNPDLDWTLSGSTFSKTETIPPTPPYTYTVTNTSTVALSDSVTVAYMKTVIDALEFPDDSNGGSCTSILELDSLSPTQPSLIRRSRYRFAAPVGFTGSTWEMQWDVVFFPKAYDDWVAAGSVGTPPSPLPSLVSSHSWIKTGSTWSDWYEIPAPEEEGESRVVNLLVLCWRSSKTGQKPTAHGEVYVFPEE